MPLQTEVPLALQDQLWAEYKEGGEIQRIADKHGLSWSLVKRLAVHEKWDERLQLVRDEYALAAATVAAKAAKQLVEDQIEDVKELRKRGKELFDSAAMCSDLEVRAKAESTADGHYASGDKIRNQVLDRVMPTSDGKPGVAVQVNVDNRRDVRVLSIDDLRKLPDAALDALEIVAPEKEPTDAS